MKTKKGEVLRKLLAVALVIWLGGAIGMSVYYELRLRADCIDKEGLFKGIFWCDKQPMNPAGYLGTQTNFLFRGFAWPYFLFSSADNTTAVEKSGAWGVMETGTPFTIGTGFPISKEDNVKTFLLVFFNPKNLCNPELSLLAVAHGKLGDPESQEKTSTHLQISVGSIFQRDYLAVFNKYTSGIEYAIRLDDALFTEMKGNQTILIAPSNAPQRLTFPLDGFQTLSNSQYAACKSN
jgi:hypothetical protein